jgi:rod shape determining protein RodA
MDKNARRLFIIAVIISLIGLVTIYSTSYYEGSIFKGRGVFFKQLVWLCLGIVVFFIFSNFNYRRLYDLSFPLYGLSIFLLILVLISGRVRLGAQRWLEFFGFNFQPSELAKFSVILFLARYFSRKDALSIRLVARELTPSRSIIIPGILVVVPAILILKQPDLGTSIIFIFIFLSMIFVVGIKKRYIFNLLFISIALAPGFWFFLRDYQRDRLLVFLNPNLDPLGAGYTVIQSKIAVGSGRLFGRGWLSGTQNMLRFLPERHTDFVFSCFAESSGFLGGVILLFLFYFLLKQGINIVYSTRDPFGRLLGIGFISVIFIQMTINISMTIGFCPVVGLSLPLVSYGGSSMLITFASLGIIANISKRRMVF